MISREGYGRWLSVFDQLCGVWTMDVLVTAVGVAAATTAGVIAAVLAAVAVARAVICEMEMPFDVVHVRVRGVEWCVADGITSSRGHTSAYTTWYGGRI
jgi:hypothetical protein